jgi:hypothetical protein
VADARVRCQMVCSLRPASDGVNEVRIVTASDQRRASDVGEVHRGPGGVLAILDNDGVACE